MKFRFSVIFICWLITTAFVEPAEGYSQGADSIRNELNREIHDTTRVKLLNELALHYLEDSLKLSRICLDSSLGLAERSAYEKGKA